MEKILCDLLSTNDLLVYPFYISIYLGLSRTSQRKRDPKWESLRSHGEACIPEIMGTQELSPEPAGYGPKTKIYNKNNIFNIFYGFLTLILLKQL